MKRMSIRLAAILMALFLAVGATVAVSADNSALAPESGSLTIHKYLMDDVAEANGPNNGYEAGTAGNPAVPESAKPLNGITFHLYKILPNEGGELPGNGPYSVDVSNPTEKTMKDGNNTQFRIEEATVPSVTTAGGTDDQPLGIATAANLPRGYYVVVEQPDDRVVSPAAPFVVGVPMTNPAKDGWIQDVHVYPKNESMSAEKTADTSSVEIGSIVTWTIAVSVPNGIDQAEKYDIIDVLDSALDFVPGSVRVEGLLNKTDATGTVIPAANNYVVTDTNGTLKVSFTEAGRTALADYKFIRISFKTTVNESMIDRITNTVENEATVEFINQFGEEKTIETPKASIHTGTVAILKTDAKTNNPLAGAKFQIASSEENARNGKYLKRNAANEIIDASHAEYDNASDWIVTTDADGKAAFEGIKDYAEDAEGNRTYFSYWLVETEAPAGYNLLGAPVSVTFTALSSTVDAVYTVTQGIVNTTGFTLPQTGGMGTILFTVGGIVLVGIAVLLIITNRTKKHEQ